MVCNPAVRSSSGWDLLVLRMQGVGSNFVKNFYFDVKK